MPLTPLNDYMEKVVTDAFLEILEARDQKQLDTLVIQLTIEEGMDSTVLERLLYDARARCSPETVAWWDQPCECGLAFHDH